MTNMTDKIAPAPYAVGRRLCGWSRSSGKWERVQWVTPADVKGPQSAR